MFRLEVIDLAGLCIDLTFEHRVFGQWFHLIIIIN